MINKKLDYKQSLLKKQFNLEVFCYLQLEFFSYQNNLINNFRAFNLILYTKKIKVV